MTFTPSALRYCAVHGSFSLAVACHLAKNGRPSAEGFTHMRKALRMEGKQLAGRLGIGAPTISKWEKGHQDVDRFAWVVVGSLVLDAAGMTATTASRLDALTSEPTTKSVPLEDIRQPVREVVAIEHARRRQIVAEVRKVYDYVFKEHRWAKKMEAKLDDLEAKEESRRQRAIKAGKPLADPKREPHWTDDAEAAEAKFLEDWEKLAPTMSEAERAEFQPFAERLKANRQRVVVTTETIELWQALQEIDDRFDDPLLIERVLWTGRKDAKGAPKTAARIAWEARVEDPDRAAKVKWRDVEGTLVGRYYRALKGA